MKYILITGPSGSAGIETAPCFRPPLGLVLPALQDVRHELTTSAALASLISGSSPTLPQGLQIHTGAGQYVYDGSGWLDMSNEEPAGEEVISGVVTFRNPTAYDIGITW